MAKKTIPLAALVEDAGIYPRHHVDETHVGTLALALQTGVTLPPPVIDERSKRIVDGWHRVRAYRKVLGPEASIDVELRRYASEAELLTDAVALNAAHGRRLDRVDQVRAVHLLESAGVNQERIAIVLHVPEARIEKLRVRIATLANTKEPGGLPEIVPLKRPATWLSGTELTLRQKEAHDSAPGTSYLLLAHQLRDGIRHGLLNTADEPLMDALHELFDVLQSLVGEVERAA